MPFFRILLLLFVSIPILEIYLLIKVGDSIGAFATVVLVVLTAVVGVWLLRLQGFATLARAQQSMARGEMPATTLFEGLMLFFAGALLLTPGFFTDAIGFILLIPFTRQWISAYILKRTITNGQFYAASGKSHSRASKDAIEGEFISHDD
ncbi:hypothetical protein MNBD_GAMMA23-2149 [hydrothermal vent metagenome]|uniref:Exlusion protein FxsA n=1 Tax=hydrothermal vent metagenome TaxID=652676 RepID=A0A3B1AKQ5_9ZZZZ